MTGGRMTSLSEDGKKALRQSQFQSFLTREEVIELMSIPSKSQQKFKEMFEERERLLAGGTFYVGPN